MEYDIETNNTVFRNYYDFTYRTDYLGILIYPCKYSK